MRNAPRFAHLVACGLLWAAGCGGKSGDNGPGDGGAGAGSAGAGAVTGSGGSGDSAGTSGGGGGDAGAGGTTGPRGGAGGAMAGRGGATAGRGGSGGSGGSIGGATAGRGGSSGSSGGGGSTAGRGGSSGSTGGATAGRGGSSGAGGAGGATAGRGGSGGSSGGGTTGTGGTGTSGTTALGAHTSTYFAVNDPRWTATITSPAITTRATGSAIIVGVARGNNLVFSMAAATPSDNLGNPTYPQIGQVQPFTHPWEASGSAHYALLNAKGGAGFQVHTLSGMMPNNADDEITLTVVEVTDAKRIQDFKENAVVEDNTFSLPVTSGSVTTTGPATIVAFWYGDGVITTNDATVGVNNGFQVIEKVLTPGSVAQAAVAVKTVTAAGSYNVTWTATPLQGAQMWMFAVE